MFIPIKLSWSEGLKEGLLIKREDFWGGGKGAGWERSVFSKYMTWLEMFFATAPQIPDFLVLLFPLEERPVLRGASTSVLSPFKVSSRVDSFLKRP